MTIKQNPTSQKRAWGPFNECRELEEAAQKAKAQADAQGGQPGPDAGAEQAAGDDTSDVEDVDFEEVK